MDRVFEFIDDIRKRLSSPFIFSFFISWFLWNWTIWLGLLWYDSFELRNFSPTVWEFVKTNTSWWLSLWGPLISSLFYTFIFPFVNTWITWFNSWVITKREKRNLIILDRAHIPYEIFNEVEKSLEDKNKDLQDTVNKLSKTKIQNIEYESEIKKLRDALSENEKKINQLTIEHSNEIERYQSKEVTLQATVNETINEFEKERAVFDDVSVMDGIWDFKKKGQSHYKLTIKNGKMTFENKNPPNDTHNFTIRNFFYNSKKSSVLLIRQRGEEKLINELSVEPGTSSTPVKLTGYEEGEPVTYEKISGL